MKTLALISMEETKIDNDCSSDQFFDAPDNLLPSLDLINAIESEESLPLSQVSRLDSTENRGDDVRGSTTLFHRSSTRSRRQKVSIADADDSSFNSSAISEISQLSDVVSLKERRNKIISALKNQDKVRERSESPRFRPSSDRILLKSDGNEQKIEKSVAADSHLERLDGNVSNFLVLVAGFVIKAIGFQMWLLISFISFPFWLMHYSYMLMIRPFQTVKSVRDRLYEKFFRICSVLFAMVSPSIRQMMQGSNSSGKFAVRIGWGCLWSFYVCCVLSSILVLAFIVGGITMRYVVEEPIQVKEVLNFDYTKANPVAFVRIMSCDGVNCGLMGCREKIEVRNRVIPPHHQLQVTVSLSLPESDHNRKLGVFQVRVEFLSANGKVSSASSHPSILRFKSSPIRYFETFLKSAPLLAGYSSESQLLSIRMTGFTEGTEPTACLRVILEQRAEFKPGAGLPEIYEASLALESELPFIKRIIWKWRKTIFIWTSMSFFMMELFVILVCCRPVLFPRAKPRNDSGNRT